MIKDEVRNNFKSKTLCYISLSNLPVPFFTLLQHGGKTLFEHKEHVPFSEVTGEQPFVKQKIDVGALKMPDLF